MLFCLAINPKAVGKITNPEPAVYISNHLSYVDIFLILSRLPGNFKFMADTTLFRIPVLGRVLKLCGYIRVEHTGVQAIKRGIELAIECIHRGESILIFPEGGINRTQHKDRLKRIEYGFAKIAFRANVPVKQLVLYNTDVCLAHVTAIHQQCSIVQNKENIASSLEDKQALHEELQANNNRLYQILKAGSH